MNSNIFNNTRPSRVAGSFYPGDKEQLKREVQRYLADAHEPEFSGEVTAVIAPHAGYEYSAAIAAPAYKALTKANFDTLVIIGHDFGDQAKGIISVLSSYENFETPLGIVPVDTELVQALLKQDRRFIVQNHVHDMEHTIEVHLPFIQELQFQCKIVPALFGEVTVEHCQAFANALQAVKGNRRIVVLSSTDLAHYPSEENSKKIDKKTLDFIQKMDLAGLCQFKKTGCSFVPGIETPICSVGGVGVAMCWSKLQHADRVVALRHGSSADAGGYDPSRVVSYASFAFVKKAGVEKETADRESFSISEDAKAFLLKLARHRIESDVHRDAWQEPDSSAFPELQQSSGVFVTLQKGNKLRGCIGTTTACFSIAEGISYFAHAAAFEDPRFPEVSGTELSDLRIEISVLSPLKRVTSAAEIIPNQHGVDVRQGSRSGLFLPQVWEQLPDKEQFMSYLCVEKAGLSATAWKDPQTELFVFTVVKFQEEITK